MTGCPSEEIMGRPTVRSIVRTRELEQIYRSNMTEIEHHFHGESTEYRKNDSRLTGGGASH